MPPAGCGPPGKPTMLAKRLAGLDRRGLDRALFLQSSWSIIDARAVTLLKQDVEIGAAWPKEKRDGDNPPRYGESTHQGAG
jgi:hypothetical protein